MVLNNFLTLDNEIFRFLLAAISIIVLLILESRIRKLDKGKGKFALVLNRLAHLTVYIIGIGFVIWLTNTHKIILGIEAEQGITTKIIEAIVLLLGAKFIVNNFSDIFERVDDLLIKTHDLSRHSHDVIKKVFKYSIYFLAFIFTLAIFDLTGAIGGVLAGAGFLGIVIGFAAKDTIGNFFAGVTLLADKPYKIGDYVEVINQNLSGTVDEISIRSTRILQTDNTLVTVPNSTLANNPIINYTTNRYRKLLLPVGIAYESDVDKAVKILTKALPKLDFVVPDKEVQVLVKAFGQSSVDLEIRVWVDIKKEGPVTSRAEVMKLIKDTFDKNGIEIPYPRRYVINETKKPKKK